MSTALETAPVKVENQTFLALAGLFIYPDFNFQDQESDYVELKKKVDQLSETIAIESSESSSLLLEFRKAIEKLSAHQLEEVYTNTFDISPSCYIYAGYLLFGESNKRLEFLVKLKEKFKQFDFKRDDDLSDHLSVLIEFLGTIDKSELLFKELMEDCLLPSLNIMKRSFDKIKTSKSDKNKLDVSAHYSGGKNPYYYLICMAEKYFLTFVPEDYEPIEVSPEKADFDPEELYEDQNESACGGCEIPQQAMNKGNRPPFIKYEDVRGSNNKESNTIVEGEIK